MLIGVDGNEANVKEKVGVHIYAFEILWEIYRLSQKSKRKNEFIIFLKNKPFKDLPKENKYWKYEVIKGEKLWIITKLLPRLFKSPKPDVFFTPSHYLPPVLPIPSVCTIHDLGYLKFSGQFRKYDFWQLKYWTAISVYISKYIICVSNSTKKDVVRHYPKALNKTIVALHGYDKTRFNPKISDNDVRQSKNIYKIKSDYILYLSTLKPSKNIEGLVKAFAILRKQNNKRKIKLVIAGKKGWMYESIFKLVKDLKIENSVIFTGYVKERYKPGLIRGGRVFVSPSYWEGFGIHVLEAMACGVPVVVSDIPAYLEIADDSAIYVDPSDLNDIASGIDKILSMAEKRYNNYVDKVIIRSGKFSWTKSARKVLNVLDKASGLN